MKPCRIAICTAVLFELMAWAGALRAHDDLPKNVKSPDGRLILGITDHDVHFTLSDVQGQFSKDIEIPDIRFNVDGGWIDDTLIWTDSSAGFLAGFYDLWNVSTDPPDAILWKRVMTFGGDCSLSPQCRTLVCFGSDRMLGVEYLELFDLSLKKDMGEEDVPRWGGDGEGFPEPKAELKYAALVDKKKAGKGQTVHLSGPFCMDVAFRKAEKCRGTGDPDRCTLLDIKLQSETGQRFYFNTDYAYDCFKEDGCLFPDDWTFYMAHGMGDTDLFLFEPRYNKKNGQAEFRLYKLGCGGIKYDYKVHWAPSGNRFAVRETLSCKEFLTVVSKSAKLGAWKGTRFPLETLECKPGHVAFSEDEKRLLVTDGTKTCALKLEP